jgi:hypothetical protein
MRRRPRHPISAAIAISPFACPPSTLWAFVGAKASSRLQMSQSRICTRWYSRAALYVAAAPAKRRGREAPELQVLIGGGEPDIGCVRPSARGSPPASRAGRAFSNQRLPRSGNSSAVQHPNFWSTTRERITLGAMRLSASRALPSKRGNYEHASDPAPRL